MYLEYLDINTIPFKLETKYSNWDLCKVSVCFLLTVEYESHVYTKVIVQSFDISISLQFSVILKLQTNKEIQIILTKATVYILKL